MSSLCVLRVLCGEPDHRLAHRPTPSSINTPRLMRRPRRIIMADRPVGGGHLGLRGMISLEPWTIRGCGYPDLLATDEVCRGDTIHDRQHPHDQFMETKITRGKETLDAAALKVGERVSIDYVEEKKMMMAQAVKLGAAPVAKK